MSAYSAYEPVEFIIDYATQPSLLVPFFLPEYDLNEKMSRGLRRRNYARDGLARHSIHLLQALTLRRRRRLRRRRSFGFNLVLLHDACMGERGCADADDAHQSSSEHIATPGADGDECGGCALGVGPRTTQRGELFAAQTDPARAFLALNLFNDRDF